MVGIGNADIGCGICGNIGDDIVIDLAIVGIKPQIHLNVGIAFFKSGDGVFVDLYLRHVGVVFCPEGNLVVFCGVELLGNGKGTLFFRAVTGRERENHHKEQQDRYKLFHPFVPPLDTPSMIFLRNSRNSTISGREMTTTAAIMAGIFSRPKPFSRIS